MFRNKLSPSRAISKILSVFQVLCIAGAWLLNDLSHKKVGVNHHVVFKKQQHMQSILNGNHMVVYQILFIAIVFLVLFDMIRQKKTGYYISVAAFILWSLILGAALFVPGTIKIPAYSYLLLFSVIVWCLEILKFSLNNQNK